MCTKRGGVMKPTIVKISQLVFESTNPNYTDFQKRCIEYYKIHNLSEKIIEETINEDFEKDGSEQKDEGYEEKLYYNFQTMKDFLGIFNKLCFF